MWYRSASVNFDVGLRGSLSFVILNLKSPPEQAQKGKCLKNIKTKCY